jgi:hypothetical protein
MTSGQGPGPDPSGPPRIRGGCPAARGSAPGRNSRVPHRGWLRLAQARAATPSLSPDHDPHRHSPGREDPARWTRLVKLAATAWSGSTEFGCSPDAQNVQIRNGAHLDQLTALGRPERRLLERFGSGADDVAGQELRRVCASRAAGARHWGFVQQAHCPAGRLGTKITPPGEDQAVPACLASGDSAVTATAEAVRAGHRRGRNGRHVSGPNPVLRPATAVRHPQAAGTTSLIGPLLAPVAAPRSTSSLPCELRVCSPAAAWPAAGGPPSLRRGALARATKTPSRRPVRGAGLASGLQIRLHAPGSKAREIISRACDLHF